MYTVDNMATGAVQHGVDWQVITDHGYAAHEKSSVEATSVDVRAARRKQPQRPCRSQRAACLARHRIGQSDPFQDLWCYTNPIFIDV